MLFGFECVFFLGVFFRGFLFCFFFFYLGVLWRGSGEWFFFLIAPTMEVDMLVFFFGVCFLGGVFLRGGGVMRWLGGRFLGGLSGRDLGCFFCFEDAFGVFCGFEGVEEGDDGWGVDSV